ncbi:MAG: 30S ribosomal protein S8 [Candidatus Shapirobacteria bacterium]|nr:30S ribosomal protein S8 [Candidatus Shapirobacteria bacterium]
MINSTSSDFLIRIKNGYRASRKSISAPASKYSVSLAEIIKKYNYIADYSVTGDIKKTMTISLSYNNNQPKVTEVRLFSKPGRRLYEKSSSLPWGKTKDSLIIISTSSGLMSQKEATKKGLGGEIIAEIW